MAKRTRVSLSALAEDLAAEGHDDDTASAERSGGAGGLIAAPLSDLTPNPHNPRDSVGNLDDLAGIVDMQLQPATAVTAGAYLKLYPDDEISTPYVIINGCRRYAAATLYGRDNLEIVIKDELAADRTTLMVAAIEENLKRLDLDVIEEAKAVDALVTETGSGRAAAARLGKTAGWVSQRRALLELHPDLQQKLRDGELAIREARTLAAVPLKAQVDKWLAQRERSANPKPKKEPQKTPQRKAQRAVTTALGTFHQQPDALAAALRNALGDDGIAVLIAEFTKAGPP